MDCYKYGKICHDKNLINDDSGDYVFRADCYKPQHESHSLNKIYEFNCLKTEGHDEFKTWNNSKYRTFMDKSPSWNNKCNAYTYNFGGRVKQASIKNFQIVPFGCDREESDAPR